MHEPQYPLSNPTWNGVFPTKKVGISKSIIQLVWMFVIGAILFKGFGNTIFGIELPNNVSAYLIYCALLLQIVTLNLRLPTILIWLFGLIFLQTFLLNFSPNTVVASFVQLVGVIIFSLTIFSFVSLSLNRWGLLKIVKMYYLFCFIASCIAILQTTFFVLLGQELYLQDMLGGPIVTTGRLSHDVFGLFPRSASISSEPAHFAVLVLPAVYLAVMVLLGRSEPLHLRNRWIALILILGLLLSFSLLGYIGLTLVLFYIMFNGVDRRKALTLLPGFAFILGLGYAAVTQIPFFQAKIETFLIAPQSIGEYEFTGNDLSGFALISNALVATSSLQNSYLLGTGLKTHENNYDQYMPSYFSSSQILIELNKTDAGSLFIRIASEFGIPGLVGIMWFLYRYKLRTGRKMSMYRMVNDICFIFLVVYMARSGSYIDASLWLFTALYYYSFMLEKRLLLQNTVTGLQKNNSKQENSYSYHHHLS